MITLDMRTVIFGSVMITIICLLVIILLWYQSRSRFSGTSFWVVGYAFQTGGTILVLLRGIIPDAISMVGGNTLVIAGSFIIYLGLERFLGKHGSQIHNYVLLVVFVIVYSYFSIIQPNLALRTLNISIGLLIICFQCMWLLLVRIESGIKSLTLGPGIVFAGFCLISIIRIIEFFLGGKSRTDFFQSGSFDTLIIIAYQMLYILQTYTLALMVNKRLFLEVKTQEEKFSKAFHSSPYAVTLTRLSDGKMIEVNEGFVKITGYGYSEVLGKTTVDLHLWDKNENRLDVVSELSKTGSVYGREFLFHKKSGELITGLFSAEIIQINSENYVLSSISDITDRKRGEEEREKQILELKGALQKVRTLSGFLPICASCKKIRDDKGYWTQIEAYIADHSDAEFSHAICPECMKKLYPDDILKNL
jgi:PAS domain S-box-containing protein